MKELLLSAPEGQLDPCLFPKVRAWTEPDPTALEVLEVLDACVNGSLASGFIVAALRAYYSTRVDAEGTTHEKVVQHAVWRERDDPPTDGAEYVEWLETGRRRAKP